MTGRRDTLGGLKFLYISELYISMEAIISNTKNTPRIVVKVLIEVVAEMDDEYYGYSVQVDERAPIDIWSEDELHKFIRKELGVSPDDEPDYYPRWPQGRPLECTLIDLARLAGTAITFCEGSVVRYM